METFCDLNRHSSSCIYLLFKTWGAVLWTFAQIMSVVLKYEVSIHFTGMTKTVSLQQHGIFDKTFPLKVEVLPGKACLIKLLTGKKESKSS